MAGGLQRCGGSSCFLGNAAAVHVLGDVIGKVVFGDRRFWEVLPGMIWFQEEKATLSLPILKPASLLLGHCAARGGVVEPGSLFLLGDGWDLVGLIFHVF